MLRFDNRVAIITGAGNGLGRAYALLLGSRGAHVVVNDLGVQRDGVGSDTRPADDVVREITSAGGSAVADYHSVEDGDSIVKTALDAFGRVDIVVNNAGILRDRSFARLSNQDWDLVHAVHLRGAFMVTRAAFPHMKAQGYGRVIMTSSVAGIYGNFGQANYSAAKLGLHGLSRTVAAEGGRYDIHCNTVAPMGGTRLTQDILPPELFESLKPELIAPLVAWLCHEDCEDSGSLFEAAGGWFGKYRFERSVGAVCRGSLDELVSPEAVRDRWEEITSFRGALHPTSNAEAVGILAGVLQDLKGQQSVRHSSSTTTEGAGLTGPLAAVGWKQDSVPFTYTARDVILYALGVGASTRDAHGLRFLYEGNKAFSALPTFAIIASQSSVLESDVLRGAVGGWTPNLARLLHGEQHLELHRPLPPDGATLHSVLEVQDVLDKRTGASLVIKVTTSDDSQQAVATTQWILYIGGEGGFGGRRVNDVVVPLVSTPPSRDPDARHQCTTTADQAALYRLSGDRNPLHIDPDFAALGGFKQPILHGLCSLGVACRAVVETYADGDVARFKAIKTRFTRPVIPGQTVVTEMWQEGTRVLFRCVVQETGEACLSGGYVDLHPKDSSTSSTSTETSSLPATPTTDVFRGLQEKVKNNGPALVEKIRGRFLWNVTVDKKQAAQWTVDLKQPPGAVYTGAPLGDDGSPVKPDVTLTLDEGTLVALVSGHLNAQKAFMSGQLRVSGNIMMSQKLKDLFDTEQSKM